MAGNHVDCRVLSRLTVARVTLTLTLTLALTLVLSRLTAEHLPRLSAQLKAPAAAAATLCPGCNPKCPGCNPKCPGCNPLQRAAGLSASGAPVRLETRPTTKAMAASAMAIAT